MSLTPFTFFLDWKICGQFVGLCWSQAKRMYSNAGLDVQLIPWQEDGRSIVEKVLEASADNIVCAGSSEDNLLCAARAEHKPVKVLATTLQHSPLVLITRADGAIKTLTDLPGKRLVMHSDGNRILEAVLALQGIDYHALSVTEAPYDLGHLTSGTFDAIQGYAMSEPIELARSGFPTRLIPIRHSQLHPYSQVFFASDAVVYQHAEVLGRFLQASFRGWREAMIHQDEAAEIVVAMMDGSGHQATEREIIRVMTPYVMGDVGLEHFGFLDLQRWEGNLATYAEVGITTRTLTVDEMVVANGLLTPNINAS
jgi:ABC-type nitrate/sulfonate/bicarbonate transport system substrate-binding protein